MDSFATETSAAKLLKATVVGGLLFLLPLIIVALLLGQAVRLAGIVTQPISSLLPLDQVIGPGGERLVAIAGLVVITIAAGFIARTHLGRSMRRSFEHSFLGALPQYQMIKSMA